MKIKLLFLFFIQVLLLNAQEVISSYGLSSSNANGSIDATLGEVVISTQNDGTIQLTQGFHQTKLAVLAVDNLDSNFKISIYPNPSSNVFYLDLVDPTDIHYKIFSINGRLLLENDLKFSSNQINLDQIKNGIYFLGIYKNNKPIKTYKIIKN